jgi:hypothetical protein
MPAPTPLFVLLMQGELRLQLSILVVKGVTTPAVITASVARNAHRLNILHLRESSFEGIV